MVIIGDILVREDGSISELGIKLSFYGSDKRQYVITSEGKMWADILLVKALCGYRGTLDTKKHTIRYLDSNYRNLNINNLVVTPNRLTTNLDAKVLHYLGKIGKTTLRKVGFRVK